MKRAAIIVRGSAISHSSRCSSVTSPEVGQTILAGDKPVGTMGSTAGRKGLALIRTDRVSDALDQGLPLTAGGLTIRLADPDALRSPAKPSVA